MQKGWKFRRHPWFWLNGSNLYRWRAPYRLQGSVFFTVGLFPYAAVLNRSATGVPDGSVQAITWEGSVTMPDFTPTYTVVQAYDQTLGEFPLLKVFLRIDVAAGVFGTWYLPGPSLGWNPATGEYEHNDPVQKVAGSPLVGNMFVTSLRGTFYFEEP